MHPLDALGEARRNLVTGTSRPLALTLVLAASAGLLLALDLRGITTLIQRAHEFS